MPDPTEIAVISSALPAVLAFVLQRLGRLLDSRGAEPEEDVTVPAGLVGTLQLPLQPAPDILQTRRAELELLQEALADYADGTMSTHASDQRFLRNLARARGVLEDIYGQHLTFEGKTGPPPVRSCTRRSRRCPERPRACTAARSPATPASSRTWRRSTLAASSSA